MKSPLIALLILLAQLTLHGQDENVKSLVRELMDRGSELSYTQPDSALELYRTAAQNANSIDDPALQAFAEMNLAQQYYHLIDYEAAKRNFIALLNKFPTEDFPDETSFAMLRLGMIYDDYGIPDSAIYYFLQAVEVDEKQNHLVRPDVRVPLAQVYTRLGRYEEAEELLRTNLEITSNYGPVYYSITLFEMASLFLREGKMDSFAKYNEQYTSMVRLSAMDEDSRLFHYQVMFQDSSGKVDTELLEDAIPVIVQQGELHERLALELLGQAYLEEEKFQDAYEAGSRAYELALNYTPVIPLFKRVPLNIMYRARQGQKNYTDALRLLKEINNVDSIITTEKSRARVDSLRILFQTEEKENEILEQQLEINRRTNQRNIIIVFAGVLLLGLLIIWQRLITNKKLAKQEAVLKEQHILSLEQENKILAMDAMITGQEEERKRIAKDLHDGLGGILATVKMSFETIQKEIDRLNSFSPYEKAITMLDDACDEVRRISHDMMPTALAVSGLPEAITDLGSTLENVHGIKTSTQIIGMDKRLDESREVMIFRIVQELVANIIKHSNASKAIIQLSRHDDQLSLAVEDDGVGFDIENATGGLGMKSLRSRVDYLKGNLQVESNAGHGTFVYIEIPV